MADKPFALCPLPSGKSPLGRHNNSDGGVSPSFSASYNIFYHFSHFLKAPKGDTKIAMGA